MFFSFLMTCRNRDNLKNVIDKLNFLVMEKYRRLCEGVQVQILYFLREIIKSSIPMADMICFSLLRQVRKYIIILLIQANYYCSDKWGDRYYLLHPLKHFLVPLVDCRWRFEPKERLALRISSLHLHRSENMALRTPCPRSSKAFRLWALLWWMFHVLMPFM